MGWFFGGPSFDTGKSARCLYSELSGKCGSCSYLNPHDSIPGGWFSSTQYKCLARGHYYPWDDRVCYKLDEIDPERVDCVERYKEFTGRTFRHISSMIGIILNKNLSEKPFASIEILKQYALSDETKREQVKLYDVYGALIATGLYFDINRVSICESLLPILNKVSDLIDNHHLEEAFYAYHEMVMMLYTRYSHTIIEASQFDYHHERLGLEKKEKNKTLMKK